MDYQTKPVSRIGLRTMATYFRKLFHIEMKGSFPVLVSLERLCDVFPKSNYIIVRDDYLPDSTMARCMENDFGGYTIEIKEMVYDGAYNDCGSYLGFICHEMCHVFLFEFGYTPIVTRSFSTGKIQAYRSVEWQAKALCGEVLIPFEESRGMEIEQIVQKYHVSWALADYRLRLTS